MSPIEILGIVLLAAGIVLVCIEIYIPGFGVPGISGLIAIAIGIYLKAATVKEGLMMIFIAAVIIGVMLVLSIILFKSSRIKSPIKLETEISGKNQFTEEESGSALVGEKGIALTDLRPAGKAEFGGEELTVLSKGSFIRKGSRLEIIEVNNNQIFVKGEK